MQNVILFSNILLYSILHKYCTALGANGYKIFLWDHTELKDSDHHFL